MDLRLHLIPGSPSAWRVWLALERSGLPFGTAYVALVQRARLQPGEWLLVQGGAGNIGGGALQIGKLLGARATATARGTQGRETVRGLGADHVIDHGVEDVPERVRQITGGAGADVVFDAVTGDAFKTTLECVAREGRYIVAGAAGGHIPEMSLMDSITRHFSLVGVDLDDYLHRSPVVTQECLSVTAAQRFRRQRMCNA